MDESERLQQLEARLARALADAKRWEYDPPSDKAVVRARELFRVFAHSFQEIDAFDVGVGVDGSIDITASGTESSVSMDVSPDGERLDAATGNYRTKTVTWVCKEPSLNDLLKEIERAA